MLDSIHHMTLKLLENCNFWGENVNILPSFMKCYKGSHYVTLLICKPLVVYRFYCMALYHSQRRRHVIKSNTKTPQVGNYQFGKQLHAVLEIMTKLANDFVGINYNIYYICI